MENQETKLSRFHAIEKTIMGLYFIAFVLVFIVWRNAINESIYLQYAVFIPFALANIGYAYWKYKQTKMLGLPFFDIGEKIAIVTFLILFAFIFLYKPY